jgi:hypothetical protein
VTSALDRLDFGVPLPGDLALPDRLDVHLSAVWHRVESRTFPPSGFCLVCGGPAGDMDECDGCAIDHDVRIERGVDL